MIPLATLWPTRVVVLVCTADAHWLTGLSPVYKWGWLFVVVVQVYVCLVIFIFFVR